MLYHACETLWQVRGGEGNARSPEAEVESKGQIEMLEMEMHRDKLGPEETQISELGGQGPGPGRSRGRALAPDSCRTLLMCASRHKKQLPGAKL